MCVSVQLRLFIYGLEGGLEGGAAWAGLKLLTCLPPPFGFWGYRRASLSLQF